MADISKLVISDDFGEFSPEQSGTRLQDTPNAGTQKMVTRDVTQDFIAAASSLSTSQLVQDEYFTLHEAVGALEIMDPKMDSGYLTGGDAFEDDYDILRDLLPEEVLGIMDQMLCFEEEDFVANLYHRKLLTDFESTEIDQNLDDAMNYLKLEQTALGNVGDALINRLEFRRYLLSAVRVHDLVDSQKASLWDRCIELLPKLKSTTPLGKSVPGSFSMKIQRRLASSVPPRPIVILTFDDAHEQLSRVCQYGKEAYRALDYYGGTHLLTFVLAFQSRKPQPSVYVRSLLQTLIFSEMKFLGTMSFKQLLIDDLEEIVLPADALVDPRNGDVEAPQDPRFQMMKRMDDFITRAADPYLDIFRTLCMNRSRLRRMLCHLVLEWESVQVDAETYDTELRKYTNEQPMKDLENPKDESWAFPLSSWAYFQKLRQMEWIVQMGFELDIYQSDEFAGMYWYLQHVASTQVQHLERIRTFVTQSLKNISRPKASQVTAFRRSISFLDFATLEASAIQSFADGLSCLFSFLAHLGLLPQPYHAMPYSTPSMQYSLRMRPFQSISLPEVPSFTDFISLVSLRTPNKSHHRPPDSRATSWMEVKEQAFSILSVADQALKIARKEWEAIMKADPETARCVGCEDWWRASTRDVLRSCITANIMVATAKKALANVGSKSIQDALTVEIPESNEGYHPWWVVPRIAVVQSN
ncbi:N-alpha-acetyltransferase, non-catalitic subunit [Lecanora helva]